MTHRRGWMGLAALAVMAGVPLRAQSPWLPASDPVGIARSGAGVAYGRSLEAAALNPALLVTLPGKGGAYLAGGMASASGQSTLQSNSRTLYTDDRNRAVAALGAFWSLGESFALGLKLDTPFLRQGELPREGGLRFSGSALDLSAHRLEAQFAWAIRPDFSVGLGVGIARLSLDERVALRAVVPVDPALPVSATNTALGLVETELLQEGRKTVPSASLGFRWALGPRWTVAGAVQGPMKADLTPEVAIYGAPSFYGQDGFGSAPSGMESKGAALLGASTPIAERGRLVLPGRASVGVRQRLNQFFTWEADLRFVGASSMEFPDLPTLRTPSGLVRSPRAPLAFRSGFGGSLMGEFLVGKRWVLRGGLSLDPAALEPQSISPLLGGASSAGFSAGVGYALWGGELSVGYQFRQSRDLDTRRVDGQWDISGYRPSGTLARVEGMGHLWAIGYRKSF